MNAVRRKLTGYCCAATLLCAWATASAQNNVIVRLDGSVNSFTNSQGPFRGQVLGTSHLISGELVPAGIAAEMKLVQLGRGKTYCLDLVSLRPGADDEMLVEMAGLAYLVDDNGREMTYLDRKRLGMGNISLCGESVMVPAGTIIRFDGVTRDIMAEMRKKQQQAAATSAAAIRITLADPTLPGAEVFVDGSKIATVPSSGVLAFSGTPGQHSVRATKEGFETWEETYSWSSGETANYHPQLRAHKPALTESEVETLLKQGLEASLLVDLLKSRGVNFSVDSAAAGRLRAAGATAEVIQAIQGVKRN